MRVSDHHAMALPPLLGGGGGGGQEDAWVPPEGLRVASLLPAATEVLGALGLRSVFKWLCCAHARGGPPRALSLACGSIAPLSFISPRCAYSAASATPHAG